MKDFLDRFMFDGGMLAVAVGHPTNLKHYKEPPTDLPPEKDVYFGPALRKPPGGAKKADVVGSLALWVDVDDENYPQPTFPPTVAVRSGHGWHLYWFLDKPLSAPHLEECNQILANDIPLADQGSWNANRVLRVPGTTNNKDPDDPVYVRIRLGDGPVYQRKDFATLAQLDRKVRHKVRTGDRRGYRSRSERDWAVVTGLLEVGAEERLIRLLFANQPVGDKHRDEDTPRGYLDRTISKAKDRDRVTTKRGLIEREDGYYDLSKRGARRLSTFIIHPKLLLDASGTEGGVDAILCDVSVPGYRWTDITFTRTAFTGVRALDKEAPIAAWQWLGRDDDVRRLLPHLMEKLKEQGLPRVQATPTLGLHMLKSEAGHEWYFVGDKETVSHEEVWTDHEGPIVALPTGKVRPRLVLAHGNDIDRLRPDLSRLVQLLGPPEAIWPLVGWFAASPFKPYLDLRGFRFPILNVTGTRGSGKTTLIQRVMMPLFGQVEPVSYDAGTTRFVTLALMGGTNAVPISFSEFRYASVEKFLRYILLSYDTGHDPRGRADQTTVDYPLSAPFAVDGEDLIVDPAAQERLVVVQLHPEDIVEGGEAYNAYKEFEALSVSGVGGDYIQRGLRAIRSGEAGVLLERASEHVRKEFSQRLPDRVRRNHIVAYWGILLWTSLVGGDTPDPSVLSGSIRSVYNVDAGRGRTMADEFVEAVANVAAADKTFFAWGTEQQGREVWFQLATSHNWWMVSTKRQGRMGLERSAIRTQLLEMPYSIEPKLRKGVWMYGVDLQKAQDAGLDVPNKIGAISVKRKKRRSTK